MSHLTLETLARLIDDAPDPTETGHLDICEQCRTELEAMRADAAALSTLPDPEPPTAQWIRLEHRLEREGLIRRGWRWQPIALRMAAAIAVFVLGGTTATLVLRSQDAANVASNDVVPTPVRTSAPLVSEPAATFTESSAAPGPVMVATQPAARVAEPRLARTPQEAAAQLRSAESAYLDALSRFAELSGRVEEGDPLARLAALESIVATTRAALGNAPADPIINGYHLTAVAQRDALLRQVSASGQTWY